jgi:four helix bundle protein
VVSSQWLKKIFFRFSAMARSDFENLRVFRLAEELADAIWAIAARWEPFVRGTVGRQLVRAADSIGANIAEGAGRGSYQDNRRFIRVARGSLNETKYWLRRAYRRGLLTTDQIGELKTIIDEISPSLNAYLRSIGTGSVREERDSSYNAFSATDHQQPTTN